MSSKKNCIKKVSHFLESKPGVFEKSNLFHVKQNSVPLIEYTAINTFCWNIRDGINVLFEKDLMGNKICLTKRKRR